MQSLEAHEDCLREWYEKVRPRFIDLIGDFGGSQLFLIEGDSLLYRYGFDPESHWVNMPDPIGGAQILALTHHIEGFLNSLLDRGCEFHVIFFDAHQSIWSRDAKMLVVRRAIIEHLKANATKVTLKEFEGWWGEVWEEYLSAQQPLFALVGDGSTEYYKLQGKKTTNDTLHRRLALLCQGFMFFCIERDISIALFPGIQFRDSRALAWVFDRMGIKSKLAKLDAEILNPLLVEKVEYECSLSLPDLIATTQNHKEIHEQRMLLTIGFIAIQQAQGVYPTRLLRAFLRHAVLLNHVSLETRVLEPLETKPAPVVSLLEAFFKISWHFMADAQQWHKHVIKSGLSCNLADLVDARFFAALWVESQAFDGLMPPDLQQVEDTIWRLAVGLSQGNGIASTVPDPIDLEQLAHDVNDLYVTEPLTVATRTGSLLPFSFPLFESYLGDMHIPIAATDIAEQTIDRGVYGNGGLDEQFLDIYHWHSTKGYEYTSRKWTLRIEQKYAAFLERYAKSLDNTHNITILVESQPKLPGKAKMTNKSSYEQPKLSKKEPPLKKAQILINNNIEQKSKEGEEKMKEKIRNALAEVSRIELAAERLKRFSELLSLAEGKEHTASWILMSGYISKLQLQFDVWAEIVHKSTGKPPYEFGMDKAMDVYRLVFYIKDRFSEFLDAEVIYILNRVLRWLDLPKSAAKISETPPAPTTSASKSKLAKPDDISFKWPRNKDLSVGMSDVRFQMRYGAHSMERNTDSREDPRVKSFKPDAWQVRVLNVIDRDESALVCCPTSAGKTFIAFYAMEKVLRADNEGIIVYVAPTKPLVNQVLAEVYGRFKKSYPDTSGKSYWGVYTRDYRENHNNCQILVTVPEMLEILLLSPQRCETWAPNIRRIIFDEVHSIGEAGRGAIWEHLLLIVQCPILALSATVGNPVEFKSWIEKAQAARQHPMRLIRTDKRYSELQKFAYIPSWPLRAFTGVQPSPTDSLVPVHPCSGLSTVVLAEKGFPNDMKVLPSECLDLYEAMCREASPEDRDMLAKFDPDVWFQNQLPITKTKATEYEKDLKSLFQEWATIPSKRASVSNVISDLGREVCQRFNRLEAAAVPHIDVYNEEFLDTAILNLATELNAQDKLPAIFFMLDRNKCVDLAYLITDMLVKHEETERANNKSYQQKKERAIQQEDQRKKQAAKLADVSNSKKKGSKDDDDDDLRIQDSPSIFDWEKDDPRFTFVKDHQRMPADELDYLLERAAKNLESHHKPLLKCLLRGIGVHHAGLPRRYRDAVEVLFRSGHLRIVIATGTLAMGINMPCKTTVFVGDSVYLNALNYRQMSGRSGRRGFDPVGNVIFFGFMQTKINRLMISSLPKLTGHFPLTTTLVLRAFLLLTQCTNKEYCQSTIKGLLGESFFCLGREHLSDQIKHHLRFSIEYLRRENFLDEEGRLLNLAGAASHLYYVEPSNFAFAVLYKHGIFHRICADVENNKDKVMDDLMLVLSHLFNRIPLWNIDPEFYREILRKYSSKIFLPDLPQDAKAILNKHNDRVLEIYTTYITTYAARFTTPDNTLPLSNLAFPPSNDPTLTMLTSRLRRNSPSFVARSPFIALASGRGDTFRNADDLAMHLRSSIYLDAATIPSIHFGGVQYNAYLRDFFTHGQEVAIIHANMIRPGDLWQKLDDFELILRSITSSLKVMETADENVRRGFELVEERFRERKERVVS